MILGMGELIVEFAASQLLPSLLAEIGTKALLNRGARCTQCGAPARSSASLSNSPRRHLTAVQRVSIISDTPGRVRLSIAGTRGDAVALRQTASVVRTWGWVESVQVNAITGTMLIYFERGAQASDAVREAVELLTRQRSVMAAEDCDDRSNFQIAV